MRSKQCCVLHLGPPSKFKKLGKPDSAEWVEHWTQRPLSCPLRRMLSMPALYSKESIEGQLSIYQEQRGILLHMLDDVIKSSQVVCASFELMDVHRACGTCLQ